MNKEILKAQARVNDNMLKRMERLEEKVDRMIAVLQQGFHREQFDVRKVTNDNQWRAYIDDYVENE